MLPKFVIFDIPCRLLRNKKLLLICLRCQAVDVAGEEDGFFDVAEVDDLFGEAVDAETAAAVGREAVLHSC